MGRGDARAEQRQRDRRALLQRPPRPRGADGERGGGDRGRQARHRAAPGPRALRRVRRARPRRARPDRVAGCWRRRSRSSGARASTRTTRHARGSPRSASGSPRSTSSSPQHLRGRAHRSRRRGAARRPAGGLPRGASGRRRRAGHGHDRLPRLQPVHDVRARTTRSAASSTSRSAAAAMAAATRRCCATCSKLRAEKASLLGYSRLGRLHHRRQDDRVRAARASSSSGSRQAARGPRRAGPRRSLLQRYRQDEPEARREVADWQTVCSRTWSARSSYEVDSSEVRQYFPYDRVLAGLLDITGRIFDLALRAGRRAAAWHGTSRRTTSTT